LGAWDNKYLTIIVTYGITLTNIRPVMNGIKNSGITHKTIIQGLTKHLMSNKAYLKVQLTNKIAKWVSSVIIDR